MKFFGEIFFNELKEIEEEIKLDRTLFEYFDRCFKLNKVLAKHNYFLKFFERRNMYRFLIKKKVHRKNEVTRNLSSSVLEKFNDYEMIRTDLSCQEKTEVVPIDVVYQPIYNENILVPCYFTLAYRIYLGYFDKEKGQIKNKAVHHCHYCQNLFVKSKEQMKKHLSFCGAKEEITYAFDNGQILNYQDNFKYLSELPFTVYFNFETTTRGNSVFFLSSYVCNELLSNLFILSVLRVR